MPRRKHKGGRPRKSGERYACGKIKPQGPNQLVVDRRKMLCEDVTMATRPLDVAYARGWITEEDHRMANAYLGAYRAAQTQGPKLALSKDRSVRDSADVRADLNFAHMTDKEIAAVWNNAMSQGMAGEGSEARLARADARWRALNALMTAEQRLEVFNVCVLDSWPQWVIQRLAEKMNTSWERKRDLLIAGLDAMKDREARAA